MMLIVQWCYALGGVMAEVEKAYADLLDVEVLSGGMVCRNSSNTLVFWPRPIKVGWLQ